MKKWFVALMLALSLFVGTAFAEPLKWDKTEKYMFGALIATHVVDLMQTEYALDHGAVELNPIMKNPATRIGLKAVSSLVTLAVVHYLPSTHKWRKIAIAVPIAINVGVIGNNMYVSGGLKLSF